MQWFEKRLFKALLNSKTLDTNLSESKIKQGVLDYLTALKYILSVLIIRLEALPSP